MEFSHYWADPLKFHFLSRDYPLPKTKRDYFLHLWALSSHIQKLPKVIALFSRRLEILNHLSFPHYIHSLNSAFSDDLKTELRTLMAVTPVNGKRTRGDDQRMQSKDLSLNSGLWWVQSDTLWIGCYWKPQKPCPFCTQVIMPFPSEPNHRNLYFIPPPQVFSWKHWLSIFALLQPQCAQVLSFNKLVKSMETEICPYLKMSFPFRTVRSLQKLLFQREWAWLLLSWTKISIWNIKKGLHGPSCLSDFSHCFAFYMKSLLRIKGKYTLGNEDWLGSATLCKCK